MPVPEGLSALDLDTIRLTAQFVARHGKGFLTGALSTHSAASAYEESSLLICNLRMPWLVSGLIFVLIWSRAGCKGARQPAFQLLEAHALAVGLLCTALRGVFQGAHAAQGHHGEAAEIVKRQVS